VPYRHLQARFCGLDFVPFCSRQLCAWQLWWEKLQRSGIVGSQQGSGGLGGVGGSGGYRHMQVKTEDRLPFPTGHAPERMAPSHSGADAYGRVNIKSELPQTDGADAADQDESGAPASRPRRRLRRGDYVEVEVAADGASILNVEQLDGAGAGPRKRKHGDDGDGESEPCCANPIFVS